MEDRGETVDLFFENGLEGLHGDVSPGEARAARRDHDVDRRIGDPFFQLLRDRVVIVTKERARSKLVARVFDACDERIAGDVIARASRVRDRHHRDADGNKRYGLVKTRGWHRSQQHWSAWLAWEIGRAS